MKRVALPVVGLFVSLLFVAVLITGCQTLGVASGDSVVFAQTADPQLGFGEFSADAVRFEQEALQINQSGAELTVICGDLVNSPNTESYKEFSRIIKDFKKPVYSAPGNHDVGTVQTLDQYRKHIGPDHQTFVAGNLAFVMINSELIMTKAEPDYTWQKEWLTRQLQQYAKTQTPIIIVMHHPPFIDNPNEANQYFNLPKPQRKELIAQFKQYGVIAVLHGHTHNTRIINFDGITYASSPTTSQNFDKKPYGFFLWRYDGEKLSAELIPLTGVGNKNAPAPAAK